ncbi:PREDICTED: interleukin-12 receptor subunit beta-2-like [Poecilia mexicana]|uniref:Fibronectin type-III domain-containing protein n=1 Tax=Poecilia mexicana TaxID=48701 RepID=A0A3B3WSW1_9TELE|nr:PREDICTED: interleukin-12 receptor subunit beta-2-like [Poecilia mexicana]
MFLSWSVTVVAVALLVVQQCAGEKTSCVLWSSAGAVVQRGSSFVVYCTFFPGCKTHRSMYIDGRTKPPYERLNDTTISLRVENITEKRTYSCTSDCNPPLDDCGLDITAGYPPDKPKNISCIYRILKNDTRRVNCSWDRGRDTYLNNRFVVRVGTASGNQTGLVWSVSGTSANFTLPRSVQLMSVQIEAHNSLGSENSSIVSYNLSDIVMPSTPVVDQVECSSRNCTIKVEQPVRTPHLQIQYRDERQCNWTTYPDSVGLTTSFEAKHIPSLEPCSVYSFRVQSRFSTGLWSPWSAEVSSVTEEEAPAQHLDVWLAAGPDFRSMRVYWNESSMSVCRGSIVQYTIRVNSSNLTVVTNVSADVKNHSVPFCSDCAVTVQAVNSKGSSPPATMTTRHTTAKPILDVQVTAENHTVAISWRKAETAPTHYVVEWYPEGHVLDELRWARLDGNEIVVTLTDINPWECYEGAVYVFYNQSSISRTSFKGIATLEAAPEIGPSAQEKVERNKVTVSWTQLRRVQRRGCITKFTIYLENSHGVQTRYSAEASQTSYPIEGLPPDSYSLWMSASTSKGEGPTGQKIKFYIEEDDHLSTVLMCVFVTVTVLFTLFLWKSSVVKHRFKEIFQCLMPDVVPDPANSKWAKECTKEKGKMNLHLPSHNSSFTDPEEETILVDVEELCRRMGDSSSPKSDRLAFPPESGEGQETELSALLYPPLTTYIKSLSHDSDSSGHTQTSLDTNTTIDYISSHGQDNLDNYDQEDEEEFPGMQFFPSLSILMEPVGFGGKLTLDAVKIDCGDFFQNV